MPISQTPNGSAKAHLLADWWEISVLEHEYHQLGIKELVGRLDAGGSLDNGDDDQNVVVESLQSNIISEINFRIEVLKEAYPFKLQEDGETLEFSPAIQIGSQYYLMCLGFSHTKGGPIVQEGLMVGLKKNDPRRLLFEKVSALALAGYVEGPAMIFGTSSRRRNNNGVVARQKRIYAAIGDGIPLGRIPSGVSTRTKDNGIDLIGWKLKIDGIPPHQSYIICQVASGKNWKSKSAKIAEQSWHRKWFATRPQSTAKCLTIIPFRFAADVPLDPFYDDVENETDWRIERLTEHENIISRTTAPGYVHKGQILKSDGITPIEGEKSKAKLQSWYDDFILSIRTRAAA